MFLDCHIPDSQTNKSMYFPPKILHFIFFDKYKKILHFIWGGKVYFPPKKIKTNK
jgi:hypothetical protein